jgi:ketosteroid isomerase-like protein
MRCVLGQALKGLAILAMCALLAVPGLRAEANPEAIRAVLSAQQAAWNRGDVDGFMLGYENSDSTAFVGATITRGYRQVLENYHRRYPSKEKMGQLTFSAIEVMAIGADYASVLGRWHLDRSREAGGEVGGIFTLLFRKTVNGWKIILDHTS